MRQVIADTSNRRVAVSEAPAPRSKEKSAEGTPAKKTKKKSNATAKKASNAAMSQPNQTNQINQTNQTDALVGKPCPVCGKGVIIKGKTAYGCSNWKEGCTYRQPFTENPEA